MISTSTWQVIPLYFRAIETYISHDDTVICAYSLQAAFYRKRVKSLVYQSWSA